jgi:hypothetical protein
VQSEATVTRDLQTIRAGIFSGTVRKMTAVANAFNLVTMQGVSNAPVLIQLNRHETFLNSLSGPTYNWIALDKAVVFDTLFGTYAPQWVYPTATSNNNGDFSIPYEAPLIVNASQPLQNQMAFIQPRNSTWIDLPVTVIPILVRIIGGQLRGVLKTSNWNEMTLPVAATSNNSQIFDYPLFTDGSENPSNSNYDWIYLSRDNNILARARGDIFAPGLASSESLESHYVASNFGVQGSTTMIGMGLLKIDHVYNNCAIEANSQVPTTRTTVGGGENFHFDLYDNVSNQNLVLPNFGTEDKQQFEFFAVETNFSFAVSDFLGPVLGMTKIRVGSAPLYTYQYVAVPGNLVAINNIRLEA